jgi:predicted SnoaL-like aldol condensation-catalyzing enzyme
MRTEQEAANLWLVERVYAEVLGPIDPAPVDAIFMPDYIQHNPNIATGAEALKQMLVRAKARSPDAEHRVKRMIADGDLVAVHVHVIFTPGDAGLAVVDIFRIENGRIAEHWDVAQPLPPTANNDNGMF